MTNEEKIAKIKKIGEELRITRHRKDNKIAFKYVYDKYKNCGIFINYSHFLKIMQICAVFFASREEQTIKERNETKYKFID